jgi:hypothetical protein
MAARLSLFTQSGARLTSEKFTQMARSSRRDAPGEGRSARDEEQAATQATSRTEAGSGTLTSAG